MKRSSRRYIVNRRLLLVTVAILAVALPTIYLWYKHQLRQTASAYLARAEQLEQERDWSRASTNYQRYLLLEPEDTPALVKMAEAFAKMEPHPERLYRLNSLLYRVKGRAPDRYDLRILLAENLMRVEDFAEAEKEAEGVRTDAPEYAPAANKVIALSTFGRARANSADLPQAVRMLQQATEDLPGDVELVEVAANALREYPMDAEVKDTDPATRADQLMDQLVAANPKNVEACLARYRYRVRYKLADADDDLQAALEIAPNHVDALLLSALSTNASAPTDEQLAKAELLLRRAIEVAPNDSRAYLALAMILEQSGSQDDALKWLQLGRNATDNNLDLGIALANIQIGAAQLNDAKRTLQDLELQSATYLVRLDRAARTQLENRLRLLHARLDLAEEAPRLAAPKLQTILFSSEATAGYQRSPEWMEASRLLAQIHSRSEQWDKASEYWGNLARVLPGNANVVQAAVDAYLKTGNASAAIERIDEFSRLSEPTSDLLVQLVQAHFALQLSRPVADRNWTEFEKALDTAKSEVGDRAELVFAEVNYLLADANDRPAAMHLLRTSESKFLDRVEFWKNAARAYQELDQEEDLQRALAKHRDLAASVAEHAALEATLLVSEGKFKEADELLANLGASLNRDERRRIERIRVGALAANNDLDGALQRIKRLIDADPKDDKLLTLGIDLALGAEDLETAEEWESKLRESTDNGPDARYLRARRLLLMYEQLRPQEKQELGRSIAELRAERPRWFPAVALAARLAEMQGDSRQALLDYQRAVDLGDRRAFTLQQVVSLLYEYGRFDDAQAYLSRLTADRPTDPFFDSMAVELAVKQDRSEAALELAKQSVARFPDDAMKRIVFANLLLRYGRSQEAVEVLREAARRFTNDVRVWTALFTAFVRADQIEEARRTLAALVASTVLPKERRHFVAAQGYEILGEAEEAKKQYALAIAQQPEETTVRLRFAKLLSASEPHAARDQYERVLRQDPVNGEARRELATLLASTGHEADWTRATELLALADDESPGNASINDRLRAMLLSRKGRTRAERIANCQAARSILQRLIATDAAEANDLNRILMAQVFEQEAALSGDRSLLIAARDQLRTVVDRGPPSAEQLSLYIEFLLRHARFQAANSVEESASDDANSETTQFIEDFLTDAETRLGDLRRLPSTGNDGLAALSAALSARLMQARGRDAEANAYVADFVARQTSENQNQNNQAQQFLTIGRLYTSMGAHAEAEKWYRRLMEISPNAYVLVVQSMVEQGKRQAAAELCLSISDGKPTPEMATVLANLLTVTDEQIEELPEARSAIEAVIKDHADNLELLQSEAVMRASRGQYDEAIAVFRRILEIDSQNALALNNLATLLAEKPNQRAEALQHIQRAIDIVGRQPPLLDTQGTIFFKIGDAEQAIACLEEATAGGAADARYYLHLAAAYHQANRDEDALRMLQESRAFGLEKFVLTDDDRKLLATLDEQLDALAQPSGPP